MPDKPTLRLTLRPKWRGSTLYTEAEWLDIADEAGLSPREVQIVKGLVDSLTEQAISLDLDISPHTVHTYVGRIYRKLNVCSRCELLVRVVAAHRAVHEQTEGSEPLLFIGRSLDVARSDGM